MPLSECLWPSSNKRRRSSLHLYKVVLLSACLTNVLSFAQTRGPPKRPSLRVQWNVTGKAEGVHERILCLLWCMHAFAIVRRGKTLGFSGCDFPAVCSVPPSTVCASARLSVTFARAWCDHLRPRAVHSRGGRGQTRLGLAVLWLPRPESLL